MRILSEGASNMINYVLFHIITFIAALILVIVIKLIKRAMIRLSEGK